MNAGTLSERLSAKDDPEGRRGTMAISLAGEDCGWKLTRAQEDHRPRQRLSRTQQKAAGPARWTAAQHKHRWPDEASPNVSQGGGERRKAARSASGASSTSGNHRTGLLLRICSPSSPRMYRFFVRARQSTPQIGRRTQIRLATPCLSAAQSCDLQLPVHLAEQLEVRIAGRQRHPDFTYRDANLGPDLEQL